MAEEIKTFGLQVQWGLWEIQEEEKKDILQWHLIQSLNLKADVHLQDLSQSN